MRFLNLIVLFAAPLVSFSANNNKNAQKPILDNSIEGATLKIDFTSEDINRFRLFSERGFRPYTMDDSLFFNVMAEQKAILKDYTFEDVIIETEINTINPLGKIDTGIYFGCSNPTNTINGIDGYCLNIEHDVNEYQYDIKLHEFNNGEYVGCLKETNNFIYRDNKVKLSLVIEDNILIAYTDTYEDPVFTYEFDSLSGSIGLRSYYSPSYISYFNVTSPKIGEVSCEEINELKNEIISLDSSIYTENSYKALMDYFNQVKDLDLSVLNQLKIDSISGTLRELKEDLVEKHSFEELESLINECESSIKEEDYTKNSYVSYLYCLNIGKNLNSESSIDEISIAYQKIVTSKELLIAYIKG